MGGIDGILMYLVDKGVPRPAGLREGCNAANGCELQDVQHDLGGQRSQGVHTARTGAWSK